MSTTSKTRMADRVQRTPDEVTIYRRQPVASVPVSAKGNVHPLIALLHEVAESLHRQWGSEHNVLEDRVPNSARMLNIEDNLEAEWGPTRMKLTFEPISPDA